MRYGLARTIGAALFAPSHHILDLPQRRRMRLLSMLGLTQAVLLGVGAVGTLLAHGTAASLTVPSMLAGWACVFVALYGLARTRHVVAALWSCSAALALVPISILGATFRESDVRAFEPAIYLLTSVLVASTMLSTRGTVAMAATALALIAALGVLGPLGWGLELFHAGQYVGVHAALIVVFKIHRDRIEADRAAELEDRNAQLERLRQTLEERVATRTAELAMQTSEMRMILDHVDDGLFTIDREGRMSRRTSAALVRWFREPRPREKFYEFFRCRDRSLGARMEVAWEQVVEGELPAEVALGQLPKEATLAGRVYRFTYEPIGTHEGTYLVVMSDVTGEVERAQLDREKNEAVALFEHCLTDRSLVAALLEDGESVIEAIAASTGAAVSSETARAIHTLKGNASLMAIDSLAAVCHELESQIEQEGALDAPTIGHFAVVWTRARGHADRFLSVRGGFVELSHAEFAAFQRSISDGTSREELARRFASFEHEPAERRLQHFGEHARRLAGRLGKTVKVVLNHDGVRLCATKWRPIWSALVHAVRNAVDHGIEPTHERQRAGKPPSGTLSLSVSRRAGGVVVTLADDGRGVDWTGVERAARARGLPIQSKTDLVAALLSAGISTAAETTEISGRGLGLVALDGAVRAAGGELRLASVEGQGTLLELVVPEDAPVVGSGYSPLRIQPT